jgi:hypothetical protein
VPLTVVLAAAVVYPVEDALTLYALLDTRLLKNAWPQASVVVVVENPVRESVISA